MLNPLVTHTHSTECSLTGFDLQLGSSSILVTWLEVLRNAVLVLFDSTYLTIMVIAVHPLCNRFMIRVCNTRIPKFFRTKHMSNIYGNRYGRPEKKTYIITILNLSTFWGFLNILFSTTFNSHTHNQLNIHYLASSCCWAAPLAPWQRSPCGRCPRTLRQWSATGAPLSSWRWLRGRACPCSWRGSSMSASSHIARRWTGRFSRGDCLCLEWKRLVKTSKDVLSNHLNV